uniref:Transmembrane protein 234 homolog n=1 Tax=Ascaris lumbricoides TaxID=6252 RepID=A0A0M3HZ60_ASCLU
MLLCESISAVLVAVLWGATNPFIRAGSKVIEYADIESSNHLTRLATKLWRTALCWRFSLPFALNQCASVLFVAVLAKQPITFVVPTVNSLTFLFTALFGRLIGENVTSAKLLIGSALILVGIVISCTAH